MVWVQRYWRAKVKFLSDASICQANRDLFARFFEWEEHKLRRQQGLIELDEGCGRTLCGYTHKFRAVNRWFENKPWVDLTKDDIKRVYDALEDGRIVNTHGLPYGDRQCIYNKVFKSKPFQMAGKADLAREVIEFSIPGRKDVRFVTEETFKLMVSVVAKPEHLLLLWLAWDIGENVDALLKLTKRDFVAQVNRYTTEREYLVNLPQSKIKRSRQSRSEPTLYAETARYANMILARLGPDDLVFEFGYDQARKIMKSIARKTGATTEPDSQAVRWKDLRSGMACHLLKSGWSRDEVNARLGHTPHSTAIDAYINYLALDRQESKQKLHMTQTEALHAELSDAKQAAKLAGEQARRQQHENAGLKAELAEFRQVLEMLRAKVEQTIVVAREPVTSEQSG